VQATWLDTTGSTASVFVMVSVFAASTAGWSRTTTTQ
jgi:hypothetical protein